MQYQQDKDFFTTNGTNEHKYFNRNPYLFVIIRVIRGLFLLNLLTLGSNEQLAGNR